MLPLKISAPAKLPAAWLLLWPPANAQAPDVFFPKTYDGTQNVVGRVMRQKTARVRGGWDGRQLRSRNGTGLHAPDWFLRDFPPFALDGELWTMMISLDV